MDNIKGSYWNKWDLHIHTPSSALNNNFIGDTPEEKWEKYIDALESINDVPVLGITDYFSIDGYLKILDYRNSGRLNNIKLILPNVELRILPVTGQPTAINFHFIFSPDIVDRLESVFFSQFIFTYKENPFRCVKEDLIRLGKEYLEDESTDEIVAYREGINQFKINADDISKILKKSKTLNNNCITGISNSNRDGASGIQHSSLAAVREELYRSADIIFSGNPNDVNYFLGLGVDDIDTLKSKYRSIKPCIIGSDAHELGKICKPDLKRYTWIKADYTFEGLKQIVFEPRLRIKIQSHSPIESETYKRNSKFGLSLPTELKIEDDDKKISKFCLRGDYDIDFSNNLTCIIGGRGTGKSTFIHLLYNKINKFPEERLTETSSPLIKLQLKPSPLNELRNLTEVDSATTTEFYLQNEIEGSAKNIDSMSRLLTQRMHKLSQLDNKSPLSSLYENYVNKRDEITNLINAYNQIVKIKSQIQDNKNEMETLKKQTQIIQSVEYKQMNQGIDEISSKIANHEKYTDETKKLTTKISELLGIAQNIKWDEAHGKGLLESFIESLKNSEKLIKEKYSTINANYEKEEFDKQLYAKKTELKKYLETRDISAENIEELTDASELIKSYERDIEKLNEQMTPHKEIYKSKVSTIEEYKKCYESYVSRNEELTATVSGILQSKSLSEKLISFDIRQDFEWVQDRIIKYFKEILPFSAREHHLRSILFSNIEIVNLIDDKNNILKQVTEYDGAEITKPQIIELLSKEENLEKVYLQIVANYYDIGNVKIHTMLDDRPLQNTSFGERCGIVISIILAIGTNPIVIDQPEDNLDGRYITESLLPLLREMKQHRQVVLVTRDANIVIGGDSDLIVILESLRSKTILIPSTIENIEHRDKYIWILDGGRQAFIQRELKYNIN